MIAGNSKWMRSAWAALAVAVLPACAYAATATLVPVTAITVPPGIPIAFDLYVSVVSLADFDAADLIVGTTAAGLSFSYSAEWLGAFVNVTTPLVDVGFYPHSIYIGGNNPASVGATMRVGTLTVDTFGLAEGTYSVSINPAIDGGVSGLTRSGTREPLSGSTVLTVQCLAADQDCDGRVDITDYALLPSCMAGPGMAATTSCLAFDRDGDGDVDAMDLATFANEFNGPG